VGALLDNAIKFSVDGGEITVQVFARDNAVCIEISDPGVGFPMERLPELYKPFVRIENVDGHLFGGVGVGLPIAKHVVEMHGGQLEAYSERHKGSTFTIRLPISPETQPTRSL